ncbi:hypothetical protein E2562_006369, partial [Oryza meyeriana var. granulata]
MASSGEALCGSKAVKMNGHLSFEDGWKILEQGIVQETMEKETKRLIHYLCIFEDESSDLCLK